MERGSASAGPRSSQQGRPHDGAAVSVPEMEKTPGETMSETPLVQIACAKCGRRLGVRAMSKDGPQWTEHFVSAEVAAAVADEAGWNIDAQGATCLGCQPPPEAHCYD